MRRPSQTESAYFQILVRSCSDFSEFNRFLCVQQIFVRFCSGFCAFTKLLGVHVWTFVLLPVFYTYYNCQRTAHKFLRKLDTTKTFIKI